MLDTDRSDEFFEDFHGQAAKQQKAFIRRFWWMLPVGIALSAGGLVFIAVLVRWVISG